MTGRLLTAILDELAADSDALDRLRQLVGNDDESPSFPVAPAYTVASLARELGRSERSLRGAIARGELEAVKRGRGYVISAEAVAAWTRPDVQARATRRPPARRARPGSGPMRQALG